MKAPYESAVEGFFGVVSEFITDDDKIAELRFESDKLKFELDKVLLNTTTHPKVDALVKLLIATRDIIIPMLRPVGSIAMAGFGAYCIDKGIELSPTMQAVLFGAPVAWGTSRHIEKGKQKQRNNTSEDENADIWDED